MSKYKTYDVEVCVRHFYRIMARTGEEAETVALRLGEDIGAVMEVSAAVEVKE